jgi:adenylate cyclase
MAARLGMFARGWRNIREAGWRRLALTALLLVAALSLAMFSWQIPLGEGAETGLYDLRSFVVGQQTGQDTRIMMVTYTDQTAIAARKRSPLDRGILARALRNIDTMGAKAIGIDILFDQPQDEDAELIATLRSMKTPVSIAYAETGTNEGDITYEQEVNLKQFLGRLEGTKARPASVRLDNALGVTRRWPSIEPNLPPVLGRAMLASAGDGDKILPGYEGAIRYQRSLDESPGRQRYLDMYSNIPVDNFINPEIPPEALRPAVEGRYVLIGGDLVGTDRAATTLTSKTGELPPGLAVHADMIAQMLDGAPETKIPQAALWAAALLVVACAGLTGLVELRSWHIYPLLAVQIAALLGVPFLLQRQGYDTYGLPAAGWIMGWGLSFAAVTSAARAAGAVQRRFAQGALGKYLPKSIADEIIDKPELLALHGEKKDIFVLFSDLEGFTKMSHAIPPEMVAKLLNRYLDMLSDVVLDHGGVIDKFVGDAVVAFWGAPIARPDDGQRAARAGYAIWQAGEAFRNGVEPGLPPVGKTRVGLHWGEAVVGNFGGENRIQYTALGDSMNTASRLEAANKALDSGVMASGEFAEKTGLDWWRPMGRVVLRGRSKPVDLFEPAPDFPQEDRAALYQAMILLDSDPEAAIAVIADLVQKHPGDAALVNLLERTLNLPPDRAYVLG